MEHIATVSTPMAIAPENPDLNLADGHGYMLDRTYAAAARLNFQYYLWRECLQFNIHPSIPISGDNAQICDVATGTAIWPMDVARELPNAMIEGLDISIVQAPPVQWLPVNVNLRSWNVFEAVPDGMLNRFDVVHVRLLGLVVENGDPRPIIQNLIKMLKPGGYLQWDDLNFPGANIKVADASLETPALSELREFLYSQGRNDWTLQLADIFQEEGLYDAVLYHFENRKELFKANCEQHLLTMEEFASRLASIGKKDEAARIYKLVQDAYVECQKGAALSMPRVVGVARNGS